MGTFLRRPRDKEVVFRGVCAFLYPLEVIPLFLDFDGVLHPEHCREDMYFCRLPLLEGALERLPLLQVVISSTWRVRGIDSLALRLPPTLRQRIHDLTPTFSELGDVPDQLYAYRREAECTARLRDHGLLSRPGLALEDRAWLFRPFHKHVVLVDGETGLKQVDIEELVARYRRLV